MRFARLMVVGLVLVMAASGCTSEPSLKEASAELQKDTRRLETNGVFKNPLRNCVSCSVQTRTSPVTKTNLDGCCGPRPIMNASIEPIGLSPGTTQALMENVLVQDFGYKLEHDYSQMDTDEGRFIHGVKKDLRYHGYRVCSP